MNMFNIRRRHIPPSPSPNQADSPPENYEMVKRRVNVQIAILERPLLTNVEFIIDERYKSLKLIGSGSYGIVVSAYDSITKSRVAIKKILSAFSASHMARHVLREIRLLHHLRHPNITRLLDIDVPRQYKAWDSVYIVTPLLKMDLKTALKRGRMNTPLLKKRIAYQMLVALEHMHSLGLMHRDIKSGNLLLDDKFNVQLCDLGESRFYSKAISSEGEPETPILTIEPELTGAVSTMIQSAPELSLGADYDAEVDIWAAGCVISEMIHPQHRYLFDCTNKQSHVKEIIDVVGYPSQDILEILPASGRWYLKRYKPKSERPPRIAELLGPNADPLSVDLLEQMLKFSPKQRVSAKRALEHAWFDEVREDCAIDREQYDFSLSEPPRKTSKSDLKNMVWQEVVAFHPEARR